MAKTALRVVPESASTEARDYVVQIGERGFVVRFDEGDDDAVLVDARSLILRSARDLMRCIQVAGQHQAVLSKMPSLGIELLLGLAAALDNEIESRKDLAG